MLYYLIDLLLLDPHILRDSGTVLHLLCLFLPYAVAGVPFLYVGAYGNDSI
jgi:hypothetical protein